MRGDIKVVTYEWSPDKAQIESIKHGSDVVNMNAVAVLGGLCSPFTCSWCDALRRRCQSRRTA